MLERPRSGERALLLHVGLRRPCHDDETQEFRALAESAGAQVSSRRSRRAASGPIRSSSSGAVRSRRLRRGHMPTEAELILVNQPLRAGQERNLETTLKTRVLDRNGLILDIFAQRAATFEGKLQVELAQHEHSGVAPGPRLDPPRATKRRHRAARPGETQLETDRRLVSRRIRHLRERLTRVERQRASEPQGTRARRTCRPSRSSATRTRARRHCSMRWRTRSSSAKDQLFETLDPTIRRVLAGARRRDPARRYRGLRSRLAA